MPATRRMPKQRDDSKNVKCMVGIAKNAPSVVVKWDVVRWADSVQNDRGLERRILDAVIEMPFCAKFVGKLCSG
jgi:hypothetical protein